MAIANISAWLNQDNRNYGVGVQLYEQYGDSMLLKILFRAGTDDSDYHANRLFEVLTELNANAIEDLAPATVHIPDLATIPVPAKRHSLSDDEWANTADPIKDLFTENTRLNARSTLMYNQLRIAGSDQRRLELAIQLLDDRDQMRDNWQEIKTYQATGELKAKLEIKNAADVEANTANEMAAMLRNIPTYISKDQKKLKTMPDGPKRNKILARLLDNQTKLEAAQRRLINVEIV